MTLPRRLLLLAASALFASPALAATYNVSYESDRNATNCTPSSSSCSLREAITAANNNNNASGEVDIIKLASGFYTLTIRGENENSGDLDITQSLIIEGLTADPADTVIDAATLGDRIFHITGIAGASVTLKNLTLQNATLDADNGAAINNSSITTLKLVNVIVENNQTTNIGYVANAGLGGGIYNAGILTIEDSQITHNIANVDQEDQRAIYGGGGLYSAASGKVTISGTSFTKNLARNDYVPNNPAADFFNYASGGAILNMGEMFIETSQIGGNSLVDANISESGGGISNLGGFLTIDKSTISYNTTSGATDNINLDGRTGGGIFSQNAGLDRGRLTITASTINNNVSNRNGGGIYNSGTPLTIAHSTLNNNTAYYIGGGLTHAGNQSAEVSNSTIAYNTTTAPVTTSGGGVYVSSRINLNYVTLAGNSADDGAQLYVKDSSLIDPRIIKPQATFSTSLIDHNNAALGSEAPSSTVNCGGATEYIVTASFNVETGTSCKLTAGGDKSNAAPLLDSALADNGTSPVPPTKTIALLGGDGVDIRPIAGCSTRDQRYYKRDDDSSCDAGAYEQGGIPASPEASDLKITINESDDPIATDAQLTYTMTVTNIGPDNAAAPISMHFYFPTNLTIDSSYTYNFVDGLGGTCAAGTANDLVCNMGAIDAPKTRNGTSTRQVSVTITPKQAGDLEVSAEVRAAGGVDYFPANNTYTETTEIQDKRNCDFGIAGCPRFPSSGGGGGGSISAWALYSLAGWLTLVTLRRRWRA